MPVIENTISFKYLENLQKIRNFKGEPILFWPAYLETLIEISTAEFGMIAIHDGKVWNTIVSLPKNELLEYHTKILTDNLDKALSACMESSSALLVNEERKIAAIKLKGETDTSKCFALLSLGSIDQFRAAEMLKSLESMNDIPINYQFSMNARAAIIRSENLAGILDLISLLNSQDRYLSSAMTFCNELAKRYKCNMVTLGWVKKKYIRVNAMSHVDEVNKKMEAVRMIELLMEEAFDQNTEIIFPSKKDTKTILRDHESYAKSNDVLYMCSIPLRIQDEVVAICTLERNTFAFSEFELNSIRILCDHAVKRLADLKSYDRWFGARLVTSLEKKLTGVLGYEHMWVKVLVISMTIVFAFLCFVPIPYRVEAPVILRSEDISYLTAPFDGHIEEVKVRIGDEIRQEGELLTLDQNDLFLEEAKLIAEKKRYKREAEKARATKNLADMKIAEALFDQASAQLDLIRHRLREAVIRAPFYGIIVEGDQMERLGAPVKQGEVLFKIGKIENVYVELEVRESDINNINDSFEGEIALLSRPQDTFKVKIFRIEPAAVVKEKGNVFLVHCNFPEKIPDWWRPGMTGVGKINAGKRTLLWILTHRTIDVLRLKFWW